VKGPIESKKRRGRIVVESRLTIWRGVERFLQRELVKCGKAKCRRCRRRPAHGPYWYAYTWNPKTKRLSSKYVGKELKA